VHSQKRKWQGKYIYRGGGILDKNQSNMQTKCHHIILGEEEEEEASGVAFAGEAQSAG
jgi:hypothetical protein